MGVYQEDSQATGVNGNQTNNLAPDSGAAYVFVLTSGVWSQQAYLKASNPDEMDLFGAAVAVDAGTVLVSTWREASNATGVNGNQADNSANNAGAVYLFPSAIELSVQRVGQGQVVSAPAGLSVGWFARPTLPPTRLLR